MAGSSLRTSAQLFPLALSHYLRRALIRAVALHLLALLEGGAA